MLSVFTHEVGPFHLPDFRSLIPLLFMWVVAMLVIVFEKDLGSALVLFFVFLAMLYDSRALRYVFFGLGLAAIGCVGLWALFDHVQVRVDTWLNPFADAQGTGYQLVQSVYSMADGGMIGVGVGNGMAEQIPVVESDFIFAAIAEETGLLGAAGVLLLFLCFAIRGLVTAARAKSDVSSFIATGCTSVIVMQSFIIVGGVTRLIPLTGITLPFISQGGSSLIAAFIMVGFLLKAGDQGTGVGTEMASGTAALHTAGVLGRVSLGKRLTTLMVVFALMFAALVANLTLIMVVDAEEYQNMPGNKPYACPPVRNRARHYFNLRRRSAGAERRKTRTEPIRASTLLARWQPMSWATIPSSTAPQASRRATTIPSRAARTTLAGQTFSTSTQASAAQATT